MKNYSLSFLIAVLLWACKAQHPLPKETYSQFDIKIDYRYAGDSLFFDIQSPLQSPVRIYLTARDSQLTTTTYRFDTIILPPLGDTLWGCLALSDTDHRALKFHALLGDPEQKVGESLLELPFPKNRTYRVIQGYQGKYSHQGAYSQYAIDWDLGIGDTICSADSGYVVGVIKDYRYGGSSKAWRDTDKSNYITVYHPHSGLFTQYVHLKHEGALVKAGEKVLPGQPIGLSGNTGYTDMPHLHFNVLIPVKGGSLASVPAIFNNGLKGDQLKKGIVVTNQ